MESTQSLKFAGDVSIEKVKVISSSGFFQDITAQTLTVQYYEDLFSPFITGNLIIKDSLDLVNLFPFVGEEYLELEISTPTIDKKIKGTYYIYKMTDRELLGDKEVVYKLHFISTEAIVDSNKKLSKVYYGKVSDLIKPFIADRYDGLESKKEVVVEETNNQTKYISNFWSPTKNIMYCVGNAVNKNNVPNYVFFENRDGFYFVSLDSLYASNPFQSFIYDKYNRDSLPGGGDARNTAEDYTRILDVSIPTAFDYLDRINSGMLSSRMHSYDIIKKSYTAKNYTLFDTFSKTNHLNPNPLNSSGVTFRNNAAIINYPRMFNNFNSFGDATNYKTIQQRLSYMKVSRAHQLEIVVPGRTDYTVGQKVSIILNKMEPTASSDTDLTDKMYSGFYLISAISHVITREKHECNMELIKESLQANIDSTRGGK